MYRSRVLGAVSAIKRPAAKCELTVTMHFVARTMRRMRIQYASDLHLELYDKSAFQPMLRPVAPVLALAGDVGRPDKRTYRDFLQYCSRNWRNVFVVAGNHEFYNSRHAGNWKHMPPTSVDTVHRRLQECEAIAREFPNVEFLNRRRVDSDGVAFLGCTLWTDLSEGGAVEAERLMNDYRMIAVPGAEGRPEPVTPDITSAWHWKDRAWLDSEISVCEEEGRPAIVITHHLPSYDLISARYCGNPLNAAFASRADELIRPPVRAWIAGHTHTGAHRTWAHDDGSVTLGAVNPRGYPGEQGTGYSREIFVDISAEPGNGGDTRDPLLVGAADIVEDVTPQPKRRISIAADDEIEFK